MPYSSPVRALNGESYVASKSALYCMYVKTFISSMCINQYNVILSNVIMQLMCVRYITHWGWNKMAAIFQTAFWNGFTWMKMYEFRLEFHWSVFLWVQLTIFQHWFRSWLVTDKVTSHYLNQWWLVYWHIYASLGLNELNICLSWYVILLWERASLQCWHFMLWKLQVNKIFVWKL